MLQHLHQYKGEASRSESELPATPAKATRTCTVAISREAGTEGLAIGQALAGHLGWELYSRHELLERVAGEMKLPVTLLEDLDERWVGWLEETFSGLLAHSNASQSAYMHHLVKTLQALAARGKCVIVGRGAAYLLPKETALRVRLIGSQRDRVAILASNRKIPLPEAERQLGVIDQQRDHFVRQYFGKDPADPANYDLILNRSQFSVDECAGIIAAAVTSRGQGSGVRGQ
jgi:cytidylate kinase